MRLARRGRTRGASDEPVWWEEAERASYTHKTDVAGHAGRVVKGQARALHYPPARRRCRRRHVATLVEWGDAPEGAGSSTIDHRYRPGFEFRLRADHH